MRRAVAALFALFLTLPQARAQEKVLHLNLDQGRQAAVQALRTGKPELALHYSEALLRAEPENSLSWQIRALAFSKLGQPIESRKAAGFAYRYAAEPEAKFQSAQLASRMAFAAGQPTRSQYWLRRTAIHAPDEQAEALIARDYRILRRVNPWAFRLSGEIRPSDNVNNGSDTTLEIIDGVPSTGGQLHPGSVALSGVVATLDGTLSRRLRQSETSLTTLSSRLYVQRVALSDSAKAKALPLAQFSRVPVPRNSDFASTYAELALDHAFAVGPRDRNGSARLTATLGTSWYAQDRNYNLLRLSGSRRWVMKDGRSAFSLNASAESRLDARRSSFDGEILGIGAAFTRKLGNGDSFGLRLGLRDTATGFVNTSYHSASLRMTYALHKKIGPAKISGGLILGQSTYSTFLVGVNGQGLPGGRKDQSVYADLNLLFTDYDYAGFAPMLRLRSGKRMSNHSVYESSEFSLSLGIESKF